MNILFWKNRNKHAKKAAEIPDQRLLLSIENGCITNIKTVPNECYIANADNINSIAAHIRARQSTHK